MHWRNAQPRLDWYLHTGNLEEARNTWSNTYEDILCAAWGVPTPKIRRGRAPVFRLHDADKYAHELHKKYEDVSKAKTKIEYDHAVMQLCRAQKNKAARSVQRWKDKMQESVRLNTRYYWRVLGAFLLMR